MLGMAVVRVVDVSVDEVWTVGCAERSTDGAMADEVLPVVELLIGLLFIELLFIELPPSGLLPIELPPIELLFALPFALMPIGLVAGTGPLLPIELVGGTGPLTPVELLLPVAGELVRLRELGENRLLFELELAPHGLFPEEEELPV
jgi:hypothetical protein